MKDLQRGNREVDSGGEARNAPESNKRNANPLPCRRIGAVIGGSYFRLVMFVPVILCLPAMVSSIPPLMVLVPAALAFGVQVAAAIFRFPAVLAIVLNGMVESRFRFFDRVLAVRPIIGVNNRNRDEPRQRDRHQRRYGGFSKSFHQGILLSVAGLVNCVGL